MRRREIGDRRGANLAGRSPLCRAIIVLGAERSGTSVVAEMAHRWGAYAGAPELIRAGDRQNPQGYWEYLPIWDFLAELGGFSTGASWWDASFQRHVQDMLQVPSYRDRALNMVATMGQGGSPWVWKDPALSFFLPFWKEVWGPVAYVITVRHPYDTAHSWHRFVAPPGAQASADEIAGNLLRWQYMMRLILEHVEEAEHKLFVAYENILRDPRKQAARLCDFLGTACGIEVTDDGRIDLVAQAVDPGLQHHQSRTAFSEIETATGEQKALYCLLKQKVETPSLPVDLAQYPMPPGWRELVKAQEAYPHQASR